MWEKRLGRFCRQGSCRIHEVCCHRIDVWQPPRRRRKKKSNRALEGVVKFLSTLGVKCVYLVLEYVSLSFFPNNGIYDNNKKELCGVPILDSDQLCIQLVRFP